MKIEELDEVESDGRSYNHSDFWKNDCSGRRKESASRSWGSDPVLPDPSVQCFPEQDSS
ncbi:unnamed protein product [Camellia sinensis]